MTPLEKVALAIHKTNKGEQISCLGDIEWENLDETCRIKLLDQAREIIYVIHQEFVEKLQSKKKSDEKNHP